MWNDTDIPPAYLITFRCYGTWLAEKGSKRYLWNERSVKQAIDYVLYGQGDELPNFDED